MDQDNKDAHSLPERTTPTWEMELLLSGATVFALFQLIEALHSGGSYLVPRLRGDVLQFVMVLFTYGQGAVVLLAISFSLHLMMRAYWVALVGMQSVFPSGVKLERTRAGPITKALLVQRWESMDAAIERADNRATIIFALGVAIAQVLVPVTVGVSIVFGFSMLLARGTGHADYTMLFYAGLALLMFAPYFLVTLIDKRRGDRLTPGSRGYRVSMGILRFYSRLGMSRDAFPLLAVFQNNIGERRGTVIISTIMFVVLIAATLSLVIGRNDLGYGSFREFPDPRRGMSASAEGRNYASLHEQSQPPTTPYLPDLVSESDYLKLVVPYLPQSQRHLLERCDVADADADTADAERQRRQALLACLSGGMDVRLDGVAVAAMPEWYTEPDRDLRGLLYMIPVRDLADGRHEVSVLAKPEQAPRAGEDPLPPFVIPFWR